MMLNHFLAENNKHVFVKLANYQRKNELAPIAVKLKVVRSCINAALTYGSEAWGNAPLNGLEVLQRKALKIILNVRNNTNECLYRIRGYTIETGGIQEAIEILSENETTFDFEPIFPNLEVISSVLNTTKP